MKLSKVMVLILCPLAVLVAFQNCGQSADFDVAPSVVGDGDNSLSTEEDNNANTGTVQLPDGLIALNLNAGDSVRFLHSPGMIAPMGQQSVVLRKENGRILEITEIQSFPADPSTAEELPSFYCNNSILPHCRHLTTLSCSGTSCDNSGIPVVCSEQVHVAGEALQTHFDQLSGIKTQEKRRLTSEPIMSDCGSPNVFFEKSGEAPTMVSLAQRECVSESTLYAFEGHEALLAAMNGKIDTLATKSSSCNLFHQYRWTTTPFKYSSNSSATASGPAFLYELNYKGQQIADLRFRRTSDDAIRCVSDILLNESELRSFFPESGLRYDVLKTQMLMSGAATASITYKDPSYGALGEAKFYMNEHSAITFNGGAILSPTHEAQMTAAITTLINRSINQGQVATCP